MASLGGSRGLSAANMYTLLSQIVSGLGAGLGTYTDKSTTITLGGTAQVLVALNASRKNVFVQNPSSEQESLFVNPTGNATLAGGDSMELSPGSSYIFQTSQALSINAATTGHKVVAKELA